MEHPATAAGGFYEILIIPISEAVNGSISLKLKIIIQ
jgi:hypothetical protein